VASRTYPGSIAAVYRGRRLYLFQISIPQRPPGDFCNNICQLQTIRFVLVRVLKIGYCDRELPNTRFAEISSKLAAQVSSAGFSLDSTRRSLAGAACISRVPQHASEGALS
jgi:hypothetical protein